MNPSESLTVSECDINAVQVQVGYVNDHTFSTSYFCKNLTVNKRVGVMLAAEDRGLYAVFKGGQRARLRLKSVQLTAENAASEYYVVPRDRHIELVISIQPPTSPTKEQSLVGRNVNGTTQALATRASELS